MPEEGEDEVDSEQDEKEEFADYSGMQSSNKQLQDLLRREMLRKNISQEDIDAMDAEGELDESD
jgi:hypothetical protein